MTKGFWARLPKPFFALAPMADVTDPVFRKLIAKYSRHGKPGGGPHVFWSEFVSANGLASSGRAMLIRDLAYTEGERPIVAQLFGASVEEMKSSARLVAELGFDGLDINMGCPDKTIEKQGAGACMIKSPETAGLIIQAAKDGIRDAGRDIPVSVKTRVGYNTEDIDTWIPFLLSQDIAALTVHARTRKEMSKVPAKWEYIRRVVTLRDALAPGTLIIGNGDVIDLADAREKAKMYGADGVMIGRAIFGNPWLFDSARSTVKKPLRLPRFIYTLLPNKLLKKILGARRYTTTAVTLRERLLVLKEHTALFERELGDVKSFSIMKKHFKAYVHGFEGAKELRVQLMDEGDTSADISKIVDNFLANNSHLL